jgi:hypothetical protein
MIRDIARKEKVALSRENLHEVSTNYREQRGSAYFAERLIEIIDEIDQIIMALSKVAKEESFPHDHA